MSAWIISLPLVIGIVVTIAGMIGVGIGSYAVVRRLPASDSDDSAKTVADHIRRVVGVLLGLMLSTVFAFSSGTSLKLQDSVEVEAAQLGDLHHDLSRVESEDADAIQDLISDYLRAVVDEEWQALARGEASETTDQMFLSIEDRILDLSAVTENNQQLKFRMIQDIDEISDLRQSRVYSAGSGLDWYAILVILAFALLMTTFRFYEATRWTRFYLISYAVLIATVLYSTVALPFESLGKSIFE